MGTGAPRRRRPGTAAAFGDTVAGLNPDAVVDLICFTLESATALVERLRGATGHLLHCGSIWRYGPSQALPISEDSGTALSGTTGTQKDLIARMLKEETAKGGLVTTSLHPGHIVGPGWHPIGPLGNLDPRCGPRCRPGGPCASRGSAPSSCTTSTPTTSPRPSNWPSTTGTPPRARTSTSSPPTALNVRGFAHHAASWFGRSASLETVSWEGEFREGTSSEHAAASWEHLHRSHVCSIEKAATLLGYAPAHQPQDAVLEAVGWLVGHGGLKVAGPLVV